jgi:septal ring factor EnvC (AmiA/AmiB activator)
MNGGVSTARRGRATRVAALALIGWLASPMAVAPWLAPPVAAQEDSLEAAKRQELERIQREARENREAARRLQGQEKKALGQLRRTERDLGLTRKRLKGLQHRRRLFDNRLSVTRQDLARNMNRLDYQRTKLSRRLRNLYKFGAARELEFLLSPRSFAQLLARWDFLVMVAEQDRLLLEDVQARKETVEADKRRLEVTLSGIEQNALRTDAENRRLARLRQQRASSVSNIKTQRETYEAAAAELEKTARAIRSLLAQLERKRKDEADRARRQGREPQPYTGDFARGQGQLDWPVRGSLVGRFGPEKHPRFGTTTLNNGVDIEANVGSPVRVVAKGRVDYTSQDFGTYGPIVIVNHGDGYYTLYGHLSDVMVSVGQEVTPGQVIALTGEAGSLKGPVLHFEVRKGGTPLNPESWLQ